jgi:hypothetical protein
MPAASLAYEEYAMLTKTILILASLNASVFAQPLERVLHLTLVETEQQLQEIATSLRGITEIPQVSVDSAQMSLTLHGTAAQIAAAEWLLGQWNHSGPSRQDQENAAARQYRLSEDDIVRVFRLAHAPTPRALQEIATIVRSTADIRRLFTYNAPSVITLQRRRRPDRAGRVAARPVGPAG